MTQQSSPRQMTRRQLLSSGTAFGAALVVGPGYLMHIGEAWASEVAHLKPETFATLVQMARDVYPHDRLADKYYAITMKAHDTADSAAMIEEGVAALDKMAADAGHPSYVLTGWEADRTAMLKAIESTPFFGAVRGSMVVGLYNQKEVWGHFGYEGESYSKGGYIDRGFNDIDWL
ncbi:MAG: Twin-arginine translocation pathway signal [Paracoccaceae bacterium]